MDLSSVLSRTNEAGMPLNPARSLYNYWFSVLAPIAYVRDGRPNVAHAPWGSGDYWLSFAKRDQYFSGHDWELGPDRRPTIHLNGGLLKLRHDGKFAMSGVSGGGGWGRGSNRRNLLQAVTWLGWGHFRGSYQWFVGDYSTHRQFEDHENPKHYVAEKLIEQQWWAETPWIRLQFDPSQKGGSNPGWRLVLDRTVVKNHVRNAQGNVESHAKMLTTSAAMHQAWVDYAALREKRYRLMKRQHEIALGARAPKDYRSYEDIEADRKKTLEAIVARMDITAPAKTTSMRARA